MRALVQKQLHGTANVTTMEATSGTGGVVEEVTTEVAARQITRETFSLAGSDQVGCRRAPTTRMICDRTTS